MLPRLGMMLVWGEGGSHTLPHGSRLLHGVNAWLTASWGWGPVLEATGPYSWE